MSAIRLIALDIDGTLLGPSLTITPRVEATLARARSAGCELTLVTGRMFQAARPYAQRLNIAGPIICYQGAATYDVAGGKRLTHVPLARALALAVFSDAKREGVRALGYFDDALYVEEIDDAVRLYSHISGIAATVVPSLTTFFAERASTKAVCVVAPERAAAYAQTLRDRHAETAYVTRSNPEFVEVVNPAVDKGVALGEVAQRAGIALGDVLAIGDSYNDVPLLRAAGIGVAMGSAPPELQAIARAVVADAMHDGVAEAVERFVLAPAAR